MVNETKVIYGLARQIEKGKPKDEQDVMVLMHKGKKYGIMEISDNIGNLIDQLAGCSYCVIVELLQEHKVRILSIIDEDNER